MKKTRRKFRPRNVQANETSLVLGFFAGAFVAIVGVLFFLNAQ